MIKSLISILLVILLDTTAFGQNDKDAIRKTFESYAQITQQKDNIKTLEYIYPKLFEYFPKDKLLEVMDNMYSDTTVHITFRDSQIKNISETLEIDGVKYAVLKYSYKMIFTILEEESDNEKGNLKLIDSTYEIFKIQYGKENVKLDKKNNQIEANLTREMYAINDPKLKDWKFLEKKKIWHLCLRVYYLKKY